MDDATYLLWILSGFPLAFLIATTAVLLRNFLNFSPLVKTESDPNQQTYTNETVQVSVCIPARNEAHNIGKCLKSLEQQTHPSFEVLVLDDQSDDGTAQIVEEYSSGNSHFNLIHGQPRPEGWLGKPWACHQLAGKARGDTLIFLDADCFTEPEFITRITSTFEYEKLDALTLWPDQVLKSFWEYVVIPAVYYALLSFLPVMYVYRKPRWMARFIYHHIRHWFAAACGQCIAFRRDAYYKIGGHERVKNQIVEDVALAKNLRRNDFKLKMYQGAESISCRMYTSQQEILEGFRKNFFAGFGYRIIPFFIAALLHLWVFVIPVILLPYALAATSAVIIFIIPSLVLIILHRLLLHMVFNWPLRYFWAQPLAVLWFLNLARITVSDYFLNRDVNWKNRSVSTDSG